MDTVRQERDEARQQIDSLKAELEYSKNFLERRAREERELQEQARKDRNTRGSRLRGRRSLLPGSVQVKPEEDSSG